MKITPRKVGDTIDNRYELVESCGKGSYGEVWRAKDKLLQAEVAIKFLNPILVADAALQEARNQSRIRSDNILRIRDVKPEEKYIIMDYHPNSLERLLRRRIKEEGRPLDLDVAMGILKGCMRAIDDAHNAEIVHGDIKPANILLDEELRPLLCDFGIARRAEEEGICWGPGSSTWAAPEISLGKVPDKRSDLFSLGVTLYLLLANRHPFHFADPSSLFRESDNIEDTSFAPQSLKQLRPDLEDWVEELVMGLMAREPSYREAAFEKGLARFIEPIEEIVCRSCGAQVQIGNSYCGRCGASLVLKGTEEIVAEIETAYQEAKYQYSVLYQPRDALTQLSRVIVKHRHAKLPQLAKCCSYRSFILIRLRRYEDAESAASQGIEMDESHLDSWQARAAVRYYQSQQLSGEERRAKLINAKRDAEKAVSLAWSGSKKATDIQTLLERIEYALSERQPV